MVRTIDAHQHFWRYDPVALSWIDPATSLAQDHLPPNVRVAMDRAGIDGSIAVQASQSEAETLWLLALTKRHPWIAGVVGWADLCAPDIADRIAALRHPRLVGLRHVVQDEPDDRFLLRDDFTSGVRATIAAGLAYDILIYPRQASHVPAFLDKVGDGRFILDHGGKPPIATGGWQPWADAITRIAHYPGVWCKLSGLVTEADHAMWQPDDLARYVDYLIDCFGPDRLIFGSDWPVCLLAADYARVHAVTMEHIKARCHDHVDAIFGGNAKTAYRLPDR